MTKSELIERIVTHQGQLSSKDVELAIKTMLEQMSQALATGDRIEIRGFGSFSLHYRAPRVGRNPKTGQSVRLDGKFVPHFKPGKELRDRVNEDEGLRFILLAGASLLIRRPPGVTLLSCLRNHGKPAKCAGFHKARPCQISS